MEPQPSTSRESPDDIPISYERPTERYPQERHVYEPLFAHPDYYRTRHDIQRALHRELTDNPSDPQRLIKDHEADKELAKMAILDFELRYKFKTNSRLRKTFIEVCNNLTEMYHKIEMARYGRRIKRNTWDRDLFLEMDGCLREKPTLTEDEITYRQLFAQYKEGFTAIKSYDHETYKFHRRCTEFFIKYPWRNVDVDFSEQFPCLKLASRECQGMTYFMYDD